MRRTYVFAGLIVAAFATIGIVWRSVADQGKATTQSEAADASPGRPLPLTRVVLFSSGVAYFQREGTVDGDTRIDLTFPVGDVNDLLKSLVFHDQGGGKLRAISYDGQEPMDKTLKAFALDLTSNPTLGQLLNQARGEKVEVAVQQGGNQPATMTGVIMGMESQLYDGKDKPHEIDVLNLVCAEGVRAVPLSQVSRFRFLNPVLDGEFHKALGVLASAHNTQKRTLSLHLSGTGKRTIKIGYVLENPIWKTSYRLLLEKEGKATLQGYAVVENTTDEDWKDVRLVLLASRPVSFEMDLYQPLFLPRPSVELDRFTSLRPPVYQADVATGGPVGQIGAIGQIGQIGGIGQIGAIGQIGQLGQMSSMHPATGSLGRYQVQPVAQAQSLARVRLSFEELQQRRQQQQAKQKEALRMGEAIAADPNAVEAAFQAEGAAEQYKYVVEQKLTLARQKSAMLPVMTHAVEAERVSIYNQFVNLRYPLLGVRFRNTTGQHLAQGPVTIFDDDTYLGDARLPDLSPNQQRPLGYAVDLAMEVKLVDDWTLGPKVTLDPRDHQLNVQFDKRHIRKYLIRNRSKEERRVVLDHPIRAGLRLDRDAKPIETTHSRYRFLVEAAADKTTSFAVAEEESCTSAHSFQKRIGEKGEEIRDATTNLNIQVETIRREATPELAGVRIEKGAILVTTHARQETAYRVDHGTGQKLQVAILYNTQPGRVVDGGKKVFDNGTLYRFEFEIPGKIGQQIVRERWDETQAASTLSEEKLAQFQDSPVVSARVKAALREMSERRAALARVTEDTAELQRKQKAITDEQVRLRANIERVPKESAAYKRFLDKFDTQETELEKLHTSIETQLAEEKRLRLAFDVYLKKLNVD
jgi:hypothetical protein